MGSRLPEAGAFLLHAAIGDNNDAPAVAEDNAKSFRLDSFITLPNEIILQTGTVTLLEFNL